MQNAIQCNGKRGKENMKRVPLQIRVSPETKEAAATTCEELGLTISDAVNVFLKAFVRNGGFPFDVQTETAEERRMLAYGTSLKDVMEKNEIKPADLDGWEDVEIG